MSDLNGYRDGNGRFAAGNSGGPGRPRRAVEQDYLATLVNAVPLARWMRIVDRAAEDAERGDPKARQWLSEYLLGRQPEPLTTLAATELAATLDEEILVRAAGLRESVLRRRVIHRASQYPDLDAGRPAGSGDIGKGLTDRLDLVVRQLGRDGRPE
jgi:hypothetical protein